MLMQEKIEKFELNANKTHLMSLTKLRILLALMILLMIFLIRPWKVQAAETAEVKGTVEWTGTYGMTIPDSVTLHLLRNGTDTGNTITATKAGRWAFSFGEMPLRDGSGKAYTYSVKEDTSGLEDEYAVSSTEFNIDTTSGQKIIFNSASSIKENTSLYFYYKDNSGSIKGVGGIDGNPLSGGCAIIPAKDFYLEIYSDDSGTENYDYGFKIDSITATNEKSGDSFNYSSSLPNLQVIEKNGTDYPETAHPYKSGERILWHYSGNNINIEVKNQVDILPRLKPWDSLYCWRQHLVI